MSDLPVVSVWSDEGAYWQKRGNITGYQSLSVEPRYRDAGPWSMTMAYNRQALKILKDRLITVDWRGWRLMTGGVTTFNPGSDEETGDPMLNVSGVDVFSRLGWALAFPDPAALLTNQPYPDPTVPITTPPARGTYKAPAETLVLDLIGGNFRDRYGAAVTIPVSLGRGVTVPARPRFDNLLELVGKKARRGGVGVRMGLVNTSGTRAEMTIEAFVPVDRSKRVRLSQKVGNLRSWSQTDTAPTATKVLVGGAGEGTTRVWRAVTTPESVAAANAWGGHREAFVEGPDSFDNPELDQAGEEALDSGAETTNLAITAAEAAGLQAFRDYQVGDRATAELLTGVSIVDIITAITVTVGDSGADVTPTFGDPDATDPRASQAQIIRGLRRDIRRLQARR